jgi:hypothetical protein
MILPGGYGKALDSFLGRAYWPIAVCGQSAREQTFQPDEKHMGSTAIGSVNPAVTGLAMPQDTKINRAGFRRVREMVAPH